MVDETEEVIQASIVAVQNWNPLLLQVEEGDRSLKDKNSRIRIFVDWMSNERLRWWEPDLAKWRDHLLDERRMSPASARAYLSTIRGAYEAALRQNPTRDELFKLTPPNAPPADRKAMVDELLVRLQNAIHPTSSHVAVIKVQDEADSKHMRLTIQQAEELINKPEITSLQGLRDAAVIAMLLSTGVREMELCHIRVDDLREYLGGELALRIRSGKGMKARLIPYGEMAWALRFVDTWLRRADISEGWVFRGLHKPDKEGNQIVRKTRLTMRSVQRILRRYPVSDPYTGDLLQVKPHDCRRTYARRLYDAEMELIAIQQNLGHSDTKTTLGYIGELEADKRRGKGIFNPGLDRLAQLDEF